ncbi:Histone acetyltransferase SAGA/ADA, catalytic subunit PCAF/GCN5 [Trachipleistophora hominis]|uniref:Histone acetyltransferase SAGA/ADA, catalytic subunit PCAF/GCN5 n=1 Tax=Trachipleistophora hominis TaxID=72359 RepID=L7JTY5_TRAHO|nr:Histone acetyltransferase SAGA/ADA, catalytic subunit PCAF/GCN5 [Trachipleistophora hominis]
MISPFYFSFIKRHKNFSKIENLRLFYTGDIFTRILIRLKKYKPYSIPFLYPVKKKEAYNYYDIIKHPMDLQTMLKRADIYDEQSFRHDLNLIYTNCITYNIEGLICDYARELKQYGEKLIEEEFERQMVMTENRKMVVCTGGDEWRDVTGRVVVRTRENDVKEAMMKWLAAILMKRFVKVDGCVLNVLKDVVMWRMRVLIVKWRRMRTRKDGAGLECYVKVKEMVNEVERSNTNPW